jgi:2-oxoacid:acceptor oxidoreductase gamma subunit (pyruvate/2-ketoisovalerate family)
MIEIKFFGRGGQGAVVASQILARAFFLMDEYPQCYSLFGGERRGAPVASFLRVDKEQILLKCEIRKPDHMIYLAPDLVDMKEIDSSLKPHGLILINNPFFKETFQGIEKCDRAIVDALAIAEEMGLGSTINTAVVGAYCRLNGTIPMKFLEQAIAETVPAKVEANIAAARKAYESTQILHKE